MFDKAAFRVDSALSDQWERAFVIAERANLRIRRAFSILLWLEGEGLVERKSETERDGDLERVVYYWKRKELTN